MTKMGDVLKRDWYKNMNCSTEAAPAAPAAPAAGGGDLPQCADPGDCVTWGNAPKEWNRTQFCKVPGGKTQALCKSGLPGLSNITCPDSMKKRVLYVDDPGCIADCHDPDKDPLPDKRCAGSKHDKCLKGLACRANTGWNPRSEHDNFYWACRDQVATAQADRMTKDQCASADATKYIECEDKYEAQQRWSGNACNFHCTKKDGGGWVKWAIIVAAVLGVLLLLMMFMHHGKHDD